MKKISPFVASLVFKLSALAVVVFICSSSYQSVSAQFTPHLGSAFGNAVNNASRQVGNDSVKRGGSGNIYLTGSATSKSDSSNVIYTTNAEPTWFAKVTGGRVSQSNGDGTYNTITYKIKNNKKNDKDGNSRRSTSGISSGSTVTCDSFTATPSSLDEGGGSVTLQWRTTNADYVIINRGLGRFNDADSSTNTVISSDTSFRLTAHTRDGQSTPCSTLFVDVDGGLNSCTLDGVIYGSGESYPFCDRTTNFTQNRLCTDGVLDGDDNYNRATCDGDEGDINLSTDKILVRHGEDVTLTWDGTDSNSCTLTGAGIDVSLPNDNLTLNDSLDVIMTAETIFTLTCEGIVQPASVKVRVLPEIQET